MRRPQTGDRKTCPTSVVLDLRPGTGDPDTQLRVPFTKPPEPGFMKIKVGTE